MIKKQLNYQEICFSFLIIICVIIIMIIVDFLKVARWRDDYGIDGIDLDLEEGAGSQQVGQHGTTCSAWTTMVWTGLTWTWKRELAHSR